MVIWLRWIVLTWLSGALLASPLIAATQCWDCCSTQWESLAAAKPNAAAQVHPSCCHAAHGQTANPDSGQCADARNNSFDRVGFGWNCQQCEQCAAVRSAPVDRETSAPTLPRGLSGGLAWADPLLSLSADPGVARGSVRCIARGEVPAPPLQVMFCSWQK